MQQNWLRSPRHVVTMGLAVGVSVMLAGCGGGGGGGTQTAQCTANCVSGRVQTSSGAGLSGVYVTATNPQTGQACAISTAPSASDGSYVISLATCGGGQVPVVLTAPGGVSTTTGGSGAATGGATGGASGSTSASGSPTGSASTPTSGGTTAGSSSTTAGSGGTGSSGAASSGGATAGQTAPTNPSGSGTTTPTSGASSAGATTPSSGTSGTAGGSSPSGSAGQGGGSGVLVNSWAPGQSASGVDLNPTTTSSVAAFAGQWSASYAPTDPRGDSGSCSLTVSPEGVISAAQPNCASVQSGPFLLTGTINSAGQFGGGTSTGGSYTGAFTIQQSSASGTWKNGSDGGTWSASKVGN